MSSKTLVDGIETAILTRTLEEGYGPGAWHGADLRAALADVPAGRAFERPAPQRHSIAEIALHHAYCAHQVRGRLAGTPPEPFVLEGDDWFALPDPTTVSWEQITRAVDTEQRKLTEVVNGLSRGATSPLTVAEQFELVLGITCHAVYHAGQVQLIKKLLG
jgi:hypothetical protein